MTTTAIAAPRPALGGAFWRYWAAVVLSNGADGLRRTAFPLIVAGATREPVLVAGVTVATSLPWLLFSLHLGALVDRLRAQTIVTASNVTRGVLLALLAAEVALGPSYAVVVAIAFALGTIEVAYDTAVGAMLPSLVSGDDLGRANGRLFGAMTISDRFVGPPLGGALASLALGVPVVGMGTCFLLAAVLTRSIQGSPAGDAERPPAASRASIHAEIVDGLRAVRAAPLLVRVMALNVAANLWFAATTSVFVLFVLRELGMSATGFGILLAVGTLGSLVGALGASRAGERIGVERCLAVALACMAAGWLITAVATSAAVAGVAGVVIGLGVGLFNVTSETVVQRSVPQTLLGRANSVLGLAGFGVLPFGALLGGVVASTVGLRAAYLAGALTVLLAAGVSLLWGREDRDGAEYSRMR